MNRSPSIKRTHAVRISTKDVFPQCTLRPIVRQSHKLVATRQSLRILRRPRILPDGRNSYNDASKQGHTAVLPANSCFNDRQIIIKDLFSGSRPVIWKPSFGFNVPPDPGSLSRKSIPGHVIARHRQRLCLQLLSRGRSSAAIAQSWRQVLQTIRLPIVAAYLVSRRSYRLLLRLLEAYMSSDNLHLWWTDKDSCSRIFLGCVDNLDLNLRRGKLTIAAARSRADRLFDVFSAMNASHIGYGINPIQIGARRAKILLRLLPSHLVPNFYDLLLLSGRPVPEGIQLSAIHSLAASGSYLKAINIFRGLASQPVPSDFIMSRRIWQFRRLFLKLYHTGVPIHKSDIIAFLSSFGYVDPVLYKTIIYAASKAHDISTALQLGREYETKTGTDLSLGVPTSIFNMFRRLRNAEGMQKVYDEIDHRGLNPLKDPYFVTAILLVEAQKKNSSYWDVSRLYGEFFREAPLAELGLPLTTKSPLPSVRADLLEPRIETLTIMIQNYFRSAPNPLAASRAAIGMYDRYLDILAKPNRPIQFHAADEYLLATVVASIAKHRSSLGLALGVVQDMLDKSTLPAPTNITWDHLLRASLYHHDVFMSEKIWKAMLEHGVAPSANTYDSMIMLYSKVGQEDKAGVLRGRMVIEGWSSTHLTEKAFIIARNKEKWIHAFDAEISSFIR